MKKEPTLTIILIVYRFPHLAIESLDSITLQTIKDYELIIVEKDLLERDIRYLFDHTNQKSTTVISIAKDATIAHMMNEGLKVANGKYIHYLFPGDYYISKYCFFYVISNINKKNFPDLLCYSYLLRDGIETPQVVTRSFSLKFLKRGKIPTRVDASWFLRKMLMEIDGFDPRYEYRENFDAMCRIFVMKKYRVSFSRRVLTDYHFDRKTAKAGLSYVIETLQIIYRNFGFIKTVLWFFKQRQNHILSMWWRTFKRFFWNPGL